MAKAHLLLGHTETALRILKKYNVCGVHDALIGMVYGDYLHDGENAEKYLGRAFSNFAERINDIMVGYANVFFQRRDYEGVITCFTWLRRVLRGIQPEEKMTWFDKYECVLLETMAECCCLQGQFDRARGYLREAAEKAKKYDATASGQVEDMEFFTMLHLERQPHYDIYGKTAMDCLLRRIHPEDEGVPGLWNLWQEIAGEVQHHGNV